MVCISSAPTVDLFLRIPVPMERGGWTWGEHPRFPGTLAAEYAYSGKEGCDLVRTYAVTVARLLRPAEADRFSVYARGRVTGMITAQDEWVWSPGRHAYRSTSETPWDTSQAAIRRYFELTGVLITRQKFRARIGSGPVSLPRLADVIPLIRPTLAA
jgi:hypothetical protein